MLGSGELSGEIIQTGFSKGGALRRGRWRQIVVLAAIVAGTVLHGQNRSRGREWRTDPEYDGRFTFVRLRWNSGSGGGWRGASNAWNHDYPAPNRT